MVVEMTFVYRKMKSNGCMNQKLFKKDEIPIYTEKTRIVQHTSRNIHNIC